MLPPQHPECCLAQAMQTQDYGTETNHSWITQQAKDGREGQALGTLCLRPGLAG